MSDSLQPPWAVATRLPCPWGFPGKNAGVGWHFLLQGIVLTQESNPHLLPSPALAGGFFTTGPPGKPVQHRPLDILAKVVLDNRIALDYLLAEKGLWWSVPPPPAATFWGSWNSYIISWTSHLALKGDFIKVSFFTYLILICLGLGGHGSKIYSRYGNDPA